MEKSEAVTALAALAQDNRLDVYRLLVRVGQEGLPAGEVATALSVAPNTLTFHFDRLRQAGLIQVRREGRQMIYSARYDVMNALLDYLSENCCAGPTDRPSKGASARARPTRTRKAGVLA